MTGTTSSTLRESVAGIRRPEWWLLTFEALVNSAVAGYVTAGAIYGGQPVWVIAPAAFLAAGAIGLVAVVLIWAERAVGTTTAAEVDR